MNVKNYIFFILIYNFQSRKCIYPFLIGNNRFVLKYEIWSKKKIRNFIFLAEV